jgi:hypothetical protein
MLQVIDSLGVSKHSELEPDCFCAFSVRAEKIAPSANEVANNSQRIDLVKVR